MELLFEAALSVAHHVLTCYSTNQFLDAKPTFAVHCYIVLTTLGPVWPSLHIYGPPGDSIAAAVTQIETELTRYEWHTAVILIKQFRLTRCSTMSMCQLQPFTWKNMDLTDNFAGFTFKWHTHADVVSVVRSLVSFAPAPLIISSVIESRSALCESEWHTQTHTHTRGRRRQEALQWQSADEGNYSSTDCRHRWEAHHWFHLLWIQSEPLEPSSCLREGRSH